MKTSMQKSSFVDCRIFLFSPFPKSRSQQRMTFACLLWRKYTIFELNQACKSHPSLTISLNKFWNLSKISGNRGNLNVAACDIKIMLLLEVHNFMREVQIKLAKVRKKKFFRNLYYGRVKISIKICICSKIVLLHSRTHLEWVSPCREWRSMAEGCLEEG
jgi:hypothetical protein